MKHKKIVNEPAKPATTKEVTDFITCDLCKEVIAYEYCKKDDIEISRKYGDSYPEFGEGKEVNVDLCGKCFKEKLMPWLNSEGAELIETDWRWEL